MFDEKNIEYDMAMDSSYFKPTPYKIYVGKNVIDQDNNIRIYNIYGWLECSGYDFLDNKCYLRVINYFTNNEYCMAENVTNAEIFSLLVSYTAEVAGKYGFDGLKIQDIILQKT